MIKKIIKQFEDSDSEQPIIESNGITLNPHNYFITINGVSQSLPKKMFELAYLLLYNKNRIVRRNQILSSIWGDDVFVLDRTIDVHIRKLRCLNIPNIVTHKGVGYMWHEK